MGWLVIHAKAIPLLELLPLYVSASQAEIVCDYFIPPAPPVVQSHSKLLSFQT